jgi:signal transduction histidine kinase/DNA-binding response OmpR family regulator
VMAIEPNNGAPASSDEVLRGRHVLLIDDHIATVNAWTRTLRRSSMVVNAAHSLREAHDWLATNRGERLDYVIIDDQLPDGFGDELVPRLSALHPTPVFALVTGHRNDARVMAGWQQDIPLLPKPTSPLRVLELVLQLERRRSALATAKSSRVDQPRVLVVDDSAAMVQLIANTLSDECHVDVAGDGFAGFRKAHELRPDVIVSDLNMPKLGGLELLRMLRAHPDTKHIPLVVLTSEADEAFKTKLLREGAQDYLLKPFTPQELRTRVGNLAVMARSRALLGSAQGDKNQGLDALVSQVMLQKRHAEFLSEASKLFGESMEFINTLPKVLSLFVESVVDGAMIDLVDPHGNVESAAVAYVDPARDAELRQIRAEQPVMPGTPHPLFPCLEARASRSLPIGPDGPLAAFDIQAGLSIPLLARERLIGVLTVFSSTTIRPLTAAEAALAQDLALRLALTIDHNALYREARNAVAVRDEFLTVASHELKTPINPLQLQIQMLYRKADEFVVPAQRDWTMRKLDSISRQAERLTRLIEDLLDIARINGGKVEYDLQEVDLTQMVREIVNLFEERGEVARSACMLEVEVSPNLVGRWDRLRLDQIFTNLLSNALKYGKGTRVRVTAAQSGNLVTLKVQDGGIGIKREDRERVFERFERAVSRPSSRFSCQSAVQSSSRPNRSSPARRRRWSRRSSCRSDRTNRST